MPAICSVIVAGWINAAKANNGNIPLKVNYPINKIINGTSFPFYSQPLLNSNILMHISINSTTVIPLFLIPVAAFLCSFSIAYWVLLYFSLYISIPLLVFSFWFFDFPQHSLNACKWQILNFIFVSLSLVAPIFRFSLASHSSQVKFNEFIYGIALFANV